MIYRISQRYRIIMRMLALISLAIAIAAILASPAVRTTDTARIAVAVGLTLCAVGLAVYDYIFLSVRIETDEEGIRFHRRRPSRSRMIHWAEIVRLVNRARYAHVEIAVADMQYAAISYHYERLDQLVNDVEARTGLKVEAH